MSDDAEAAKKARMSAYQRWEMASFDPVPVDRSAADQAALEKHLRRVRDEAHAQGLASGHVAGRAKGRKGGYEPGYEKSAGESRPGPRAGTARRAASAAALKTALQTPDAAAAAALGRSQPW